MRDHSPSPTTFPQTFRLPTTSLPLPCVHARPAFVQVVRAYTQGVRACKPCVRACKYARCACVRACMQGVHARSANTQQQIKLLQSFLTTKERAESGSISSLVSQQNMLNLGRLVAQFLMYLGRLVDFNLGRLVAFRQRAENRHFSARRANHGWF